MGVLDEAKFLRRKGVVHSRVERIKREGSPNYLYILPATLINVTVTIHVPTQFPLSRKYAPLDWMEIVNNEGANPILVTINNQDSWYCGIGTIRTISGEGVAIWQLAIQNIGTVTTTLGRVRLTLKKQSLTIDKWAANQ
tara:strand:- start:1465 stop:1881 length:417 start_codon:yes stop_codon:yes gene_type:complete